MENQRQFLLLIKQHEGILHKVSKLYMDNPEDRKDLLQEMTFQLWKSYKGFNGKSLFSTWMYRVCLNTALTYLKNERKKSSSISLLELKEPVDCVEENIEDAQLTVFYKAVQDLNKVEKALIFLFLEGLSHKEIAVNLGITEVNARVKLNRTKNRIQTIIKKYGYEF